MIGIINGGVGNLNRIIDMHVHVGNWYHFVYRHRQYDFDTYWTKYGHIISKAVFIPTDKKDNCDTQKSVIKNNKSSHWFWYSPITNNLTEANKHRLIKVHGGIDNICKGIANIQYRRMLEDLASKSDGVLLVHCGAWSKTSSIEYVIKVAKLFPQLKIVAAHMGGKDDVSKFKAIDAILQYDNIVMDTSATKYSSVIAYAMQKIGPTRVLFGSDWPIMSPAASIEVVLDVCTEQEQDQIFYNNAISLGIVKG